jgi:hypothetical protein
MQILLPPLSLIDVTLFFGINAVILLVTTELSSSLYGPTDSSVDKKRLENVSIVTGVLLLISVTATIITMVMQY